MKWISLVSTTLFATLFSACGAPNTSSETNSHSRIVNGEIPPETQNDERVFSTVALTDPINARENHSWCTGTLIGPRILITAGHCVGSTAWASFGRRVSEDGLIRVTKQIRHPQYQKKDFVNDIAVYVLEKPAPSTHRPAILYTGNLEMDQFVAIAGFGITIFGGKNDTGVLRQAEVQVKAVNTRPTPELVLAGSHGEDTCKGDSGGPVYVNTGSHFEVTGATSWGIGCGKEGHYTDVRAHLKFISETVRNLSLDGY